MLRGEHEIGAPFIKRMTLAATTVTQLDRQATLRKSLTIRSIGANTADVLIVDSLKSTLTDYFTLVPGAALTVERVQIRYIFFYSTGTPTIDITGGGICQ
jgi:hypothetical protein